MPDSIKTTLSYAISAQLLALYAITFVGLALSNWNVFAPFYGLVLDLYPPLAELLRALFGFLTGLVGFLIAIIGFVAILKTVADDAVAGEAAGPGQTVED